MRVWPQGDMTMSIKLTIARVAIIVASTLLAPATRDRDNSYVYKSAQYCIPQDDDLSGTTRVYC
jgi:hypothetical protein